MTISLVDTAWMTPYLNVLPRTKDPIFTEVWQNGRFMFQDRLPDVDEIDLWSARLVCAAMDRSKRLLVVLPDHAPHRPALLFASCLVMDALDAILYPDIEPNKVVYFGTRIGIREQLGLVKVHDLALSQVFPAYRTGRGSTEAKPIAPKSKGRTKRTIANTLPQVVCAYSPADPRRVIDEFEPTWLAVDCSDTSAIRWLPSLLRYAEHLELPVVAWCQSPLAATARDFAQSGGNVFYWPRSSRLVPGTWLDNGILRYSQTKIEPITVNPSRSNLVDNLKTAYQKLGEATRIARAEDRLLRDAISIGWRYLQAIELLPVPLALYEVETIRFWNVMPLERLQQTFLRFIEASEDTYAQASGLLQEAYHVLSEAHTELGINEPPLWSLLVSKCLTNENTPENQIIAFSSEYRKRLFEFGLLSRYNISKEDLQRKGVWLTTLKELYQQSIKIGRIETEGDALSVDDDKSPLLNESCSFLVVGLPNVRQSTYIEVLLYQEAVEILIYPYQYSALQRKIQEWDAVLGLKPSEQQNCLDQLVVKSVQLELVPSEETRIYLSQAASANITSKAVAKPVPTTPWAPLDPVQELTFLFDQEEELGEEVVQSHSSTGNADAQIVNTWVGEIIELTLEGGWKVSFLPDDTVQVVVGTNNAHPEDRYIRALRVNDKILFIVGQRRQNLYDLIVARVHAHPAIELHLAMIRRWHEEFSSAFQIWKQKQKSGLDDLLWEFQQKGSTLTSSQTLRLWLAGEVLAPEDVNDLRRASDILDMAFVRDNYRHINKAAQRLRNIHRALARRLNRWLQQEAAGALREAKPDTSVLDKELGLTFSDFRDSLLILQVKSLSHQRGLFLRSNLGRLERGELQ